MNKDEYLQRLYHQLSFYDGNINEIMRNYEGIINELLDEGLSMDEIIRKLGRPAELAEEIAQEFELQYTEAYIRETTIPSWAKTLLIIFALIIGGPFIFGLVMALIGMIIGIFSGIVGLIIGAFFLIFNIWDWQNATTVFKIFGSLTAIFGTLSLSIILYYIIYFSIKCIQWIFEKIKQGINQIRGQGERV